MNKRFNQDQIQIFISGVQKQSLNPTLFEYNQFYRSEQSTSFHDSHIVDD
jgi:hypothetical protein